MHNINTSLIKFNKPALLLKFLQKFINTRKYYFCKNLLKVRFRNSCSQSRPFRNQNYYAILTDYHVWCGKNILTDLLVGKYDGG